MEIKCLIMLAGVFLLEVLNDFYMKTYKNQKQQKESCKFFAF